MLLYRQQGRCRSLRAAERPRPTGHHRSRASTPPGSAARGAESLARPEDDPVRILPVRKASHRRRPPPRRDPAGRRRHRKRRHSGNMQPVQDLRAHREAIEARGRGRRARSMNDTATEKPIKTRLPTADCRRPQLAETAVGLPPASTRSTRIARRRQRRRGKGRPEENAFIRIDHAGVTTLVMQVEMGQGVYASLAIILAEELDAANDQMCSSTRRPATKLCNGRSSACRPPANSNSIRAFWKHCT